MKHKDSTKRFGLIGLGLIVVAFLIWAFVLPKFSDKTANEQLSGITQAPVQPQSPPAKQVPDSAMPSPPPNTDSPKVIRKGTFRGVQGEQGSGTASIVQTGTNFYLRLEDNFSVSNGPDLYVGFGNSDQVDKATLFAKLKANNGGQNYELPAAIDHTKYTQVFIYCKAFAHPFAIADLQNTN